MRFSDDGLELVVVLIIFGGLIAFGATIFTQYIDKARLTLSISAMSEAQKALKSYQARNQAYPASLDFKDCSDQNDIVAINCDQIRGDINQFESYVGTDKTFILKARAMDSDQTLITVTESAISY